MGPGRGRVARFKRDRYTGENRCFPCTVLNLCLAFACAFTYQVAMIARGAPNLAVLGSTGIFAVGVGIVYLRGYLVPGTPALTRRYLPAWLLAAFGKDQPTPGLTGIEDSVSTGRTGDGTLTDVEATLLDAGVLTEAPDSGDRRLTASFEQSFADRVSAVELGDESSERLLDVLNASDGDVTYEEYGDAFRASLDETLVGTWESHPAFLADVTAAELLDDALDEWDEMPVGRRGETLAGLRLFLTTCPACGGRLSFAAETVETCCSTRAVAAVSCVDCDARVFETDAGR